MRSISDILLEKRILYPRSSDLEVYLGLNEDKSDIIIKCIDRMLLNTDMTIENFKCTKTILEKKLLVSLSTGLKVECDIRPTKITMNLFDKNDSLIKSSSSDFAGSKSFRKSVIESSESIIDNVN